jgi:hypothetical protein
MIRRVAVVGGGAVLIALTLAGCQTGLKATPPGSASAPSASAGTTSAASSEPVIPSNSSTAVSSTPAECTVAHLSINLGEGGAGSGHRSAALMFRNTGSKTCRLHGYPGVAALDAHGTQIEQARRTPSGYLGGLKPAASAPIADIAPGQSASALLEALAFGPGGRSCAPYAGLLVTPPDETRSVRLAWSGDGCSNLEIHPVVPGDTGQQT